ncbi:MAG: hypothetical protein ACI9VN_001673, partial [Patescibacteria group bacterium]
MIRKTLLFVLAFLISDYNNLFAQCTDGSEPECTCGTAPVLCSVDELDGYMFSMSSYQHPGDGPSPLCPGVPSVPNNPTWFAFTAWCTDLTLECSFSNCTASGGFVGVQIAIYEDCTFTNTVACNVATADCNTNNKTLVMTGLNIGDVYYFLVDGCFGSYCDVAIDIIGVCGEEEIEPWTNPVDGETAPCAGDTETYTVDDLDGAFTYHWFVDGVLEGQTPTNTYNHLWSTPGTYNLCVDASNDPCVPITDLPDEICLTITVYESDAGTLTVAPNSLCPDEIANISVTGYNMGADYGQAILITDPSGLIVEVINASTGTFSSAICAEYVVYSYNYILATGTPPVVGNNVNAIDCALECCDLVDENLIFEDTENPQFPSPPANLILDCADLIPVMTDLEWTDNCDGSGMVAGTESGSADVCSGGSITRTWEYTDVCGNQVVYTQLISADPTTAPTFTNPPADIMVTCDNIPTNAPDLDYTNNDAGACLIAGTVTPSVSGSADVCGGTLTYTWTNTDACNNTITHTQNITVTPAQPPVFVTPPADVTVTCDNIPTSAADLDYTNSEPGACLISGAVPPTASGTADICGGTLIYTWTFTDICNNTITHVQNITVTPAQPPVFVNPPADITVTCDNIPTSAADLDYTNSEAGVCLISGAVPPTAAGAA